MYPVFHTAMNRKDQQMAGRRQEWPPPRRYASTRSPLIHAGAKPMMAGSPMGELIVNQSTQSSLQRKRRLVSLISKNPETIEFREKSECQKQDGSGI